MKGFCLFLFLLVLLPSNPALANCGFRPFSGNIQVGNVGGANLYTSFSSHLRGQESAVMEAFAGTSVEDVTARLNALLADPNHQRTIRSERAEAESITNLASTGRLRWIGIEASPNEMANGVSIEGQIEDYNGMKNLLLPLLGESKTQDILYLIYSSHIIARAENPSAFQNIPTVPLDDDLAKSQSERILGDTDHIRQRLIDMGMNQHLLTPQQFMAIDQMRTDAMSNNQLIPMEQIEAAQEGFENPDVKSAVFSYLLVVNEFLKLSVQRDETVARTALNQTGDGLIIMGTAHGAGIQRRLDAACSHGTPNSASPNQRSVD